MGHQDTSSSSESLKKDRKSRKEEKAAREYQEMLHRPQKENQRLKLLRESKTLLNELAETLFARMTVLWKEKSQNIQWIGKTQEGIRLYHERLRLFDEQSNDLKNNLFLDIMSISDIKQKQLVQESITKSHETLQTDLNRLIMTINVCSKHLQNYQEQWSAPQKPTGSSLETLQRRFKEYSEAAECIDDMQSELDNTLKMLQCEESDLGGLVTQFNKCINSVKKVSQPLRSQAIPLPSPVNYQIPVLTVISSPSLENERTILIRKQDRLAHEHSQLLLRSPALFSVNEMPQVPPLPRQQHQVFVLANWAANSRPLPKYNTQSGRLEGYFS
jgi:hypothetical protein